MQHVVLYLACISASKRKQSMLITPIYLNFVGFALVMFCVWYPPIEKPLNAQWSPSAKGNGAAVEPLVLPAGPGTIIVTGASAELARRLKSWSNKGGVIAYNLDPNKQHDGFMLRSTSSLKENEGSACYLPMLEYISLPHLKKPAMNNWSPSSASTYWACITFLKK